MINLDGIEVRDGTGEIIIHITKRDATTGRGKPDDCAAAKACCRLSGVLEARVYRTRTFLLRKHGNKKIWERYRTPDSIRNELIAFDRGGHFEPDDYRLIPVSPMQRLGVTPPWRDKKYKTNPPHKRKKLTPHVVKGVRERAPTAGMWSTKA